MIKIIGTTKSTTPCLWTFALGIQGLTKYIDCEVILYDQIDIQNRNIQPTKEEIIFICEAGIPIHANFPLNFAKTFWPNSTFVIWGTDSLFYRERGQHQVDLSYVDLYLEEHESVINEYTSLGIRTDYFDWNISERFIETITSFKEEEPKIYDFIGVYHPGTITPNKYRGKMVEYLQKHGYSFTQGGGGSHEDNNTERLIKHYKQSKICLGTSSHSSSNECKYRKGFRDFIAPFCGIPIIYDDYYEVKRTWGSIMPYYKCGDFDSLINVASELLNNPLQYNTFVDKQKEYATVNSIDKQLTRLLLKYGFIGENDLK